MSKTYVKKGDKARAQKKASQTEETAADTKALGQGITWLFENKSGQPSEQRERD